MFGQSKRIKELSKETEELTLKISRLERQNAAVQAILSSMVEGVVAVSKDTRILSLNPTIENIFAVDGPGSLGKFFLEAIRNNDLAEVINKVLKSGEFLSQELNLSWPVQKTFQVNASPIFDAGNVSGCLLVIHDITQLRKLEKMRSDFVANVSHELKTPITSIKGFVETLIEGALEDKENSREFLKIINNHTERLNNLINDLLDLSQIESRAVKLNISDFNLNELIEEVLSGFKSQLKKKGISVSCEVLSGTILKADRERIQQVLVNLIDNAVKFNKENGFVKIYTEDQNGKTKIIVEDSGQGIPEKDLPRIFERFYRVDKARSRELGGTGLGLSIVKHIIELHGGSVGVESTEGLGSKLYFVIPK